MHKEELSGLLQTFDWNNPSQSRALTSSDNTELGKCVSLAGINRVPASDHILKSYFQSEDSAFCQELHQRLLFCGNGINPTSEALQGRCEL